MGFGSEQTELWRKCNTHTVVKCWLCTIGSNWINILWMCHNRTPKQIIFYYLLRHQCLSANKINPFTERKIIFHISSISNSQVTQQRQFSSASKRSGTIHTQWNLPEDVDSFAKVHISLDYLFIFTTHRRKVKVYFHFKVRYIHIAPILWNLSQLTKMNCNIVISLLYL